MSWMRSGTELSQFLRDFLPTLSNQIRTHLIPRIKNLTHCSPSIPMLIHKDEIHKCALRNFLSTIYSTERLSTYFWITKILEQSPKIKTFRNFLQYYNLECSTKFDSSRLFVFLLDSFINIQSTLVISKLKGPSERLRDIRTSTYQIFRTEENTNRTTIFHE